MLADYDVLTCAFFLQDRSILGVATSKITTEFHSLDDIGWYGSAYLLTSCCSQLMFGKLYAGYSIKWIFLGALGIFEIGSIVCAAAPNSNSLIVGRAIAGLGATGISTGSLLVCGILRFEVFSCRLRLKSRADYFPYHAGPSETKVYRYDWSVHGRYARHRAFPRRSLYGQTQLEYVIHMPLNHH